VHFPESVSDVEREALVLCPDHAAYVDSERKGRAA